MQENRSSILISGGGIAGFTAAILLKDAGWEPLVIEREPALPTAGYMMDFFGTGWDVAERMGLIDELQSVRYHAIDVMEYVDETGRPYVRVPIERIRKSLDGRYVYLRRPDLARILHERALSRGVEVRFGTSIQSLTDTGDDVRVVFQDGQESAFALVIGADGVHSNTRRLAFGDEAPFARFLGYYVAAFQAPLAPEVRESLLMFEERDRVAGFYSIAADRMDASYIFREGDIGHVAHEDRLPLLRRRYADAGWIAERVLRDLADNSPIFLDSVTQIEMPQWSAGRVCLIGDACGCLTLIAGQGSHMAMAGAYVLTTELGRHSGDHGAAFAAYERFLKPHVERKQQQARRFSNQFIPSQHSNVWLRRLAIRAMFSRSLIRWTFREFGARSVLRDYP